MIDFNVIIAAKLPRAPDGEVPAVLIPRKGRVRMQRIPGRTDGVTHAELGLQAPLLAYATP
jgi:hypothetical protein